jgi:Ca2+-binding EF-hand superfamily protein
VIGLTPEMVGELKERWDAAVSAPGAPHRLYITVTQFAAILQSLGANVTANDPYVKDLVRDACNGVSGGISVLSPSAAGAATPSSTTAAAAAMAMTMTGGAASSSATAVLSSEEAALLGYLEFTEYLGAAARYLIGQFASYEAELIRGFELLDTTHSGYVSADAIRDAWYHAMGAGEKLTSGLPTQPRTPEMKKEIEDFLEDADPKGTNRIDYVMFVKVRSAARASAFSCPD